jgi:hypothetical protein
MEHHPVFAAFSNVVRFAPDSSLIIPSESATAAERITASLPGPALTEEYFEWIDLFESLRLARDRYIMLELGAGYGRWGIYAGRIAKALGLRDVDLRFVEAEPQHAAWAREGILAKGLGDLKTSVIEGAISSTGKPVSFAVDLHQEKLDAHSWYGQMIVDWENAPPTEERYFGKVVHRQPGGYGQIYVDSVTFESVSSDLDFVDLVDVDIQGAERDLVEHSIESLTDKVRLIHIGTHRHDIEDAIRTTFLKHGWQSRWDFACHGEHKTPFGLTSFQDGVQSWLNPRF